ncbi:MAG: tripartite tricarboxylate transporter TctB family protein [Pseudomonadota bacterium]
MDKADQEAKDRGAKTAGIDLVSSVLVMAVGIAVSLWSLKLGRPMGWKSAPGLVPLLFAGSMFFMGLSLFISSLRNSGPSRLARSLSGASIERFIKDTRTKRTFWIILFSGIYLILLSGWLPFEIAGALFLFATFAVFWRKGGWLKIILISIIVPLAFSFVFRYLFSILLPGDSLFDLFFG